MTEGSARVVVTGTGRAGREADLARATFTAEAARETATEARAASAATAGAVIAALHAAGIADGDVRTAGLDVTPSWEHDGTRMVRRGFTVTNRIGVTIRDLEAVGRVVDAGLEAGSTGLDGVAFLLDDETSAADEARRAAVADARHRAEVIADAAGARVRRLVAISESVADGAVPFPATRLLAAQADASPTPVLPGRIDVVVSVTAEWELLTG